MDIFKIDGQLTGKISSGFREDNLPTDAAKQTETDQGLQLFDLTADGTLGQMQLFRREREILVPGGGFKAAQHSMGGKVAAPDVWR